MPKYSKKERRQRRRLHRVNIPLSGLKKGKAAYKEQSKALKSAKDAFKYRPSKNY